MHQYLPHLDEILVLLKFKISKFVEDSIPDPTPPPEKRLRYPTLVRLCVNRLKFCCLWFLGFCEGEPLGLGLGLG